MAVADFYRNQFSCLETSGRGKRPARHCVGCGVWIDNKGGKRSCSPCSDLRLKESIAARRKRIKNDT
jgi:predicted nucleic acid-binding Zn ribbon protein